MTETQLCNAVKDALINMETGYCGIVEGVERIVAAMKVWHASQPHEPCEPVEGLRCNVCGVGGESYGGREVAMTDWELACCVSELLHEVEEHRRSVRDAVDAIMAAFADFERAKTTCGHDRETLHCYQEGGGEKR